MHCNPIRLVEIPANKGSDFTRGEATVCDIVHFEALLKGYKLPSADFPMSTLNWSYNALKIGPTFAPKPARFVQQWLPGGPVAEW